VSCDMPAGVKTRWCNDGLIPTGDNYISLENHIPFGVTMAKRNNQFTNPWMGKEIEILREMYPTASWKELHRALPNRTKKAMGYKAESFGIRRGNWISNEEQILIEKYPTTSIHELVRLIPRHSGRAIFAKATEIGLKKSEEYLYKMMVDKINKAWPKAFALREDFWSEDEIRLLVGNYSKISICDLVTLFPNRSRHAIESEGHNLKLKKRRGHIQKKKVVNKPVSWWSNEEREILKINYNKMSKERLMNLLPNRSWKGISKKALKIGLKRDVSYIMKKAIISSNRNPASWTQQKPTKPEKKLMEIIDKYELPFKYVGDGGVTIYGLNPDFINCNGEKKIIEVFGRAFHDPDKSFIEEVSWYQQEWGRKAIYSQLGFDTLIIWDDEMDDDEIVVERIKSFMEVK